MTWVQHLSSLETRSVTENVRVAWGIAIYFQRAFDNTMKPFLFVSLTDYINVSPSGIFVVVVSVSLWSHKN